MSYLNRAKGRRITFALYTRTHVCIRRSYTTYIHCDTHTDIHMHIHIHVYVYAIRMYETIRMYIHTPSHIPTYMQTYAYNQTRAVLTFANTQCAFFK